MVATLEHSNQKTSKSTEKKTINIYVLITFTRHCNVGILFGFHDILTRQQFQQFLRVLPPNETEKRLLDSRWKSISRRFTHNRYIIFNMVSMFLESIG